MAVLCAGMALGQDAAHDVDKGATKTGHLVRHTEKNIGHATKSAQKINCSVTQTSPHVWRAISMRGRSSLTLLVQAYSSV